MLRRDIVIRFGHPHCDQRLAAWLVRVCVLSAMLTGCAVHYYDATTGAEHVWGFGHMVMKVASPVEGQRAVVHGTSLAGVAVGYSGGELGVMVGWESRRRIEVVTEDAAVRLEWPNADFLNVRVGSAFPYRPIDMEPKGDTR